MQQGLTGGRLCDFHGINGIAVDVAGVGRSGRAPTTRLVTLPHPATGEPRALVHAIESHALERTCPGAPNATPAAPRSKQGCSACSRMRRIAMEYARPAAPSPTSRRVDAGTIELVRQFGVEVASSGDLVQQFSAVWHAAQIKSHVAASEKLTGSRIAPSTKRRAA